MSKYEVGDLVLRNGREYTVVEGDMVSDGFVAPPLIRPARWRAGDVLQDTWGATHELSDFTAHAITPPHQSRWRLISRSGVEVYQGMVNSCRCCGVAVAGGPTACLSCVSKMNDKGEIVCPECKGTGVYVGFLVTEPCKSCGGAK
jgi:hypothetical protein